ncbi:MAG: nucleotide exchange factor GrpE [Clostridiales bacterium]|jgi:hypothetical protein|nr:nucleotide exchange factor GrpE [Clostridiales bacterium]
MARYTKRTARAAAMAAARSAIRYCLATVKRAFDAADEIVGAKIARSGENGDEVYSFYAGLVENYRKAESFYENTIKALSLPDDVTNILDGLSDVLRSRVRAENGGRSERDAAERKILQDFAKKTQYFRRRFFQNRWPDLLRSFITGFNVADISGFESRFLIKTACETFEEDFREYYEFYVQAVESMENAGISDSTFYSAVITEELEILKTIIKVQIQAIEEIAGHIEPVMEFVNMLAETYQAFGKDAARADEVHRANATRQVVDNYEVFVGALNSSVSSFRYAGRLALYAKFRAEVKRGVARKARMEAERRIGRAFSRKVAGRAYAIVKSAEKMAGAMADAFNIAAVWEAPAGLFGDNEILRGVRDTMAIKVETICEGKEIYAAECREYIRENFITRLFISNDQRLKIIRSYVDATADAIILAQAFQKYDLPPARRSVINTQEAKKAADRHMEVIRSKTSGFMRDTLLGEMSTFEEILTYSAPRLRETPDAAAFVEVVDDVNAILRSILAENGVLLITPQPRDMFNAKEHEVILAEKNSEYKKGEIIKVMNSGFKRDGKVITRANVIAAK